MKAGAAGACEEQALAKILGAFWTRTTRAGSVSRGIRYPVGPRRREGGGSETNVVVVSEYSAM
jgi:hypothetical protein